MSPSSPFECRRPSVVNRQEKVAVTVFALVILTFAAYLVTSFSVRFARHRGWLYLFVGYTFAVFLNVWVPHVPASILFRTYFLATPD